MKVLRPWPCQLTSNGLGQAWGVRKTGSADAGALIAEIWVADTVAFGRCKLVARPIFLYYCSTEPHVAPIYHCVLLELS